MPRAKRPQRRIFTWTGFWLVVVLVFAAAFVAGLVVVWTGPTHPNP